VGSTKVRMQVKLGRKFMKDCLKKKEKWLLQLAGQIQIKSMPLLKVILRKSLGDYSYQIMVAKTGVRLVVTIDLYSVRGFILNCLSIHRMSIQSIL